MSRTFEQDYIYGKQGENEIINIINNYFKDNIKIISNSKSIYDFEGDNNIYELKTRTNNYNKYSTTLLGYNKVIETKKKQFFIFNFTDGLYYIEYNKDLFDTFEKKQYVRNARSDYNDTLKLYLFIPINKLIKIIY